MDIAEEVIGKLDRRFLIRLHKKISEIANENEFKIRSFYKADEPYNRYIINYLPNRGLFEFWWQGDFNEDQIYHYCEPKLPNDANNEIVNTSNFLVHVHNWTKSIQNIIDEETYYNRIISKEIYNPTIGIIANNNHLNIIEHQILIEKIDSLNKRIENFNVNLFATQAINLEAIKELKNLMDEIKLVVERPENTKRDIKENIIGKLVNKSTEIITSESAKFALLGISKELMDIFQHNSNSELPSQIIKLLS